MQLHIYNTLTRAKELFVPLMEDPNYKGPKKDFIWFYSCWPTVYRDPTIGNYRATFTADLIRNVLKISGYKVKAVMNITDVGHLVSDADEGEDKLEKGSRREGISAWDVAKKYEKTFKDGMSSLHIDQFDVMPRATDNIPEQIELIKNLEEKWYTYSLAWDGIYMDTSKVEHYGELMWPNYKKRLADLNAGERVEMWSKKNPTDFALRKFSPENEQRQMERESPRWKWFPWWHIECSAMSTKYLWTQFDIHHGGADHITIHHPNEIAQSECWFHVHPWVKYWMHNEFLQVDGGKMSKSLGNAYNLKDIEAKGFSGLDLRYFYFTAQYSSFQNFTWEQLEAAKNARNNLIKKMQKLFDAHTKIILDFDFWMSYDVFKDEIESKYVWDVLEDMIAALADDINTPQLLAIINQSLNSLDKVEEVDMKDLFVAFHRLEKNLLKVGLFDRIGQETVTIKVPSEITNLADQRVQAKKNKNYGLADDLRKQINDAWREVKDNKDGYEITKS